MVDIHAASVNGADWRVRTGDYKQTKLPFILGRDFSGVVSAVGGGVTTCASATPVFGVLRRRAEGAYAEKIADQVRDRRQEAREPVACRTPPRWRLTGLTALVLGRGHAQAQPGETILIQGGAGGVASFAIQLAKHIGARVITTTSAANVDYVRSLGADK